MKPPVPRHTVEKSTSLVRVTLPSKKNILQVLGLCLWFCLWGYMMHAFLYLWGTIFQLGEISKNSAYEVQTGNFIIFFSICISPLVLALFAMGIAALNSFFWLVSGKEVVEANLDGLKITRQNLAWKRAREYSASEIKDLRLLEKQSSFPPVKFIQNFFGLNGMITFSYRTKTIRFGLGIEEGEAKQIFSAIKEGLAQQNAG